MTKFPAIFEHDRIRFTERVAADEGEQGPGRGGLAPGRLSL